MYKLICMGFDGDYQRGENFKTIQDTWKYADNMGSKWYFYPFYFVVSESGKTIVDSGNCFENLNGMRVKTVQHIFEELSKLPEFENANTKDYAEYVEWNVNYKGKY